MVVARPLLAIFVAQNAAGALGKAVVGRDGTGRRALKHDEG